MLPYPISAQTFWTSVTASNLCVQDGRSSELPAKYICLSSESVSEHANIPKKLKLIVLWTLFQVAGHGSLVEVRWAQLSVPGSGQRRGWTRVCGWCPRTQLPRQPDADRKTFSARADTNRIKSLVLFPSLAHQAERLLVGRWILCIHIYVYKVHPLSRWR